jgi:hypothetical protein
MTTTEATVETIPFRINGARGEAQGTRHASQ